MTPRRRRGGVAIEMALVLPVLLVLVVGSIDWGWLFSREAAVVQIARDGAHAGSLAPDDPEVVAETRARAALQAGGFTVSPGDVHAVVTDSDVGEVITVTVELSFQPLIGLVPTPDVLRAETTMRVEGA